MKKIGDLTKDELGHLFPVKMVPYNKSWPVFFEKEKETLLHILTKDIALRIEHFGSTAVAGLTSKPTIDILVEIPVLNNPLKENIITIMKSIAYDFIWRTDINPPYMMFAKGYSLSGIKEQTFHVHMGQHDHSLWDRLYFRDYLREHPEILKQYAKLKTELALKFEYDRDGYTDAKTEFITSHTLIAKTLTNIKI